MRLGLIAFAACTCVLPVVARAQTRSYLGRNSTPAETVIRPAAMEGWRNYVTVPDGPCGHPMAVETDCYNACHPCGPLHPICFLHRVGRMLDSLLPCNMCCRGGGCGLFHGCILGGRTWGHCSVCCGGGILGGRGGCGGCGGGCGTNPCGSAFAPIGPSCTSGGHCFGCGATVGCSSTVPTFINPFQDDPLPPTPTAQPATEVRRPPAKKPQSPVAQTRAVTPPQTGAPARTVATAPTRTSPYKIISDPTVPSYASRPSNRQNSPNASAAGTQSRKQEAQSVLRRASAEEEVVEPAQLQLERSITAPIIRSQSPDEVADYPVPHNPLRR